jgi:hypothetical protein
VFAKCSIARLSRLLDQAVLACCFANSSSVQHSAPGDIVTVGQDLTGAACAKFPLNSLGKQAGAGYAVGVRGKPSGPLLAVSSETWARPSIPTPPPEP